MTDSLLSTQQNLVLDQHKLMYQQAMSTNDVLDSKAGTLLTASSFLTGITGIADPVFLFAAPALLLMIILALKTWRPQSVYTPGPLNWDDIFEERIHAEMKDTFNRTLADYNEAILKQREVNADKATWVKLAAYLFLIQIFIVVFVAIFIIR